MPDDPLGLDFHKTLVDNMADGVYFVEPDRTIKYWNHGAERISGYPADQVVGHLCFDNILAHVDEHGNSLCHSICPLAASMRDGEAREATIWLRHHDGHRKPVRVRTAPVRDGDGNIIGGVETFSDASASVRAAEAADKAKHQAQTDELTGLPNRRMLDEALRVRIENLSRYGWDFGFLIVDIDHFKAINDKHGHVVGDAAIASIANTLLGAVRTGDFVARWGGDEFAILVQASDALGLRETADRVRALVAQSEVRFDGGRFSIHVSIGGALAVLHETPDQILGRADRALYSAKHGGRNRIAIATTETAPADSEAADLDDASGFESATGS
jgi:diguanylate cyclase (GGDEF)-like protein/PAS domain S-box-containing protein